MNPPDTVKRLIEKFEQNRDQYTSTSYNETQLRQEFLNPFFSALGWDMENRAGVAEPYKEVIHEDSIKIGGETKAPDYAFRIGRERKFFLEAKKPSVNIKNDATPAFQLRRYAWSAKLPLSILSDFQEFAVYDCRMKPTKTDKAAAARINFLTYHDYEPKWEEIFSVFSHEAVWHGSFDKYVVDTRVKKGTDEVDDAFLREIEEWRGNLAKNIALRNSKLTVRELNFAVQRTIDRIIFLRICEDRGIENYGTLRALVNGERTYKRMCDLFYRADEKYNSGLFHFSAEKERAEGPDELTLGLQIDDKLLKDIIGGLYYPDCSYEFSVLPADILGQVYEQFLGKVIRLTAGHQAKVEEKPEVKKAGGVYYTPTHIVEYIVKNTVGKLLEDKTPKQAAQLRILDPACGSGSFLIGAYQYLLDWHRDWYAHDGAENWSAGKNAPLYRGPGGEWRLTTAERKRILLNNVYGVDIDSQAVEVTKLSLLLKVLEGENEESINQQLKMFHERALPDLGQNIKCGNSLIGPDFFKSGQLELMRDLADDDRLRINAFDWHHEFEDIIRVGGFDAVIGNPPYVRVQALEHISTDYFKERYEIAWRRVDISILFFELAFKVLSVRGMVGFIASNQFLSTEYGRKARGFLLDKLRIVSIADFGDLPIFEGALTYTSIFILTKGTSVNFTYTKIGGVGRDFLNSDGIRIDADSLTDEPWTLGVAAGMRLVGRLRNSYPSLSKYATSWYGIITGLDDVLLFDSDSKQGKSIEQQILLPVIRAQDCSRYGTPQASKVVIYPYRLENGATTVISEEELLSKFPRCYDHLIQHKVQLKCRRDSRKTFGERSSWYSLVRFGRLDVFRKPKLVTPGEVKRNKFALDMSGAGYSGARVFGISSNGDHSILKPLLGVLNSRLIEYYLHSSTPLKQGGYFSYSATFLNLVPIPQSAIADLRLRALVDSMLGFHKNLAVAKTDHEKVVLLREIDSIDKQIDELVYMLYELTEDEIKIVEGTNSQPNH